ncbi:MAG: RNA polymerase subunit sigma [Rhodovulum sp.]|uniref:RNA polymerase sigma factor n=1 Tax=Rhodovulum sp. FJ3 TaxID=3079053 RepID=UPI000C0B3C5F|nr:RNA polymerase sigma factor [Rhodovulum sp. FJ3]MAY33402.1 RNA polymerase subunit sigma [Rhodovulum sp.]MDV4168894.1 RNA polymerase sigma factor [Rhodovulum sp. FJ3]|tara:strand:- start:235 stop:738 length:504 start_codon:yes stop_codon:yes gene_type:complete
MPTTLKQDLIALLPRLRRFAFTIARSAADADDLVQEACIRALTRQDQWNPAQPLDRWVFRILRNVWIDEVRKRQVRTGQGQIPAEDASELISVETGEARFAERELHKKITEMPDELGLVVLVVSVEGYSYKEAAELLDIPVGTVMSRLHRARKQLAQDMVEPLGVTS